MDEAVKRSFREGEQAPSSKAGAVNRPQEKPQKRKYVVPGSFNCRLVWYVQNWLAAEWLLGVCINHEERSDMAHGVFDAKKSKQTGKECLVQR